MVQCLTPQSLWHTSPKSLAYLSKDFGKPCESLSPMPPKTFAIPAKDFRTPMFIPRSVNICTMENHGLYHSRPSNVPHSWSATLRFTTRNSHTYAPKPWHF
ncbi:MAG: hypothetical protein IKD33_07690 [Bacteroidales bacterium]|nr:hypothetical protein [Bacteroidales bacterium]